jgi:glycosyltransferase involved in cell wall biosynthesis
VSLRCAFVYPNPRAELAAAVAAGEAPDTGLLGLNHLAAHGIDAWIHESAARRRTRERGLRHRVTWLARELLLPWELRAADVAVTPLTNVFPLTAAVRRRPRVVLLNYGVSTTWRRASAPRRRLLRAGLRAAAAVVSLAESQRRELVDEVGIEPARAHVLELGVDDAFFQASPLPADGYVLAVGKDLARDYATLAAAADGLDARVVVVAEPRNLRHVRLPANVEVRRGLSWRQLVEAYAGAACVAVPLRHPGYPYGTEGSGLTALVESMASGRPTVVSARAVFADYVRDGENGVLVAPEDPAALREALERLLGDRDLAARLGGAARRLVEDRLTTRRFAERLAGLLRSVDG